MAPTTFVVGSYDFFERKPGNLYLQPPWVGFIEIYLIFLYHFKTTENYNYVLNGKGNNMQWQKLRKNKGTAETAKNFSLMSTSKTI